MKVQHAYTATKYDGMKRGVIPDEVGDPVFPLIREEWIEKALDSALDNRAKRSGLIEQVPRNNRIIKWHFAGLGSKRIQDLMMDPKISIEMISFIINRFKMRIGDTLADEYLTYRELNVRELERTL